MQIGLARSLSLWRAWVAFSVLTFTLLLATGAQADTGKALIGLGWNNARFFFPSDVSQFTKVRISWDGGLGLNSDGTVVPWGQNYAGQQNIPAGLNGVTDIELGDEFDLALKADGTVTAWGNDHYGEVSSFAGLTGITAISARGYTSMALKEDGTVAVFGIPDNGQLDVPADLVGVKSISAGISHCVALKNDGTVVAWGSNWSGEGDVPAGLTNVKAVSAGGGFTVALKEDGTVVAWGGNWSGQCNVPADLTGVVTISAGDSHVLALKANGTVVAWGSNYSGEATMPANLSGVISICASYSASAVLYNKPPEITVTRPSFYSGSTTPVKATVTLPSDSASARTVWLTSSDPAAVSVPATVVVRGGSRTATFALTHYSIADAKSVTITAATTESSAGVTVSLLPIAVKTITFDLNRGEGGGSFNGILTLNAAPRETLSVALSGDAPGSLFLNPSVNVAPSNTVAYFPVTTQVVPADAIVHVTAQAGGAAKTVPLTILAGPMIKTLRLSKPSVYGNQKLTGTVTLSIPAHSGGTTVYLGSEPGCTMPATVYVPEGSRTATFEITSQDVEATTVSNIAASTYYSSVGASLTIKRNSVASLDLSLGSLLGGETTTATVTLIAPVDVDTDVAISIPSGYASAPATLTILAGSSVGTVTVTANATTKVRVAKVVAARVGLSKNQTLTINP